MIKLIFPTTVVCLDLEAMISILKISNSYKGYQLFIYLIKYIYFKYLSLTKDWTFNLKIRYRSLARSIHQVLLSCSSLLLTSGATLFFKLIDVMFGITVKKNWVDTFFNNWFVPSSSLRIFFILLNFFFFTPIRQKQIPV